MARAARRTTDEQATLRRDAVRRVEPVGTTEIADRLGVEQRTVLQWRHRGLLPEARWLVGNGPAWDWYVDIVPWARDTGRL